MYKIGSTSKLQIGYQKAIIEVRRSFWAIAGMLLVATATIAFLAFIWGDVSKQSFWNQFFSFTIMSGVAFHALYLAGFAEQTEIDLMTRTVIRTMKVFGIKYKTMTTNWPVGHNFKYSIEYGSYETITAIWLEAYSNEIIRCISLVRFFDKETFIAFQKIFNEHFPDHKIIEWHD